MNIPLLLTPAFKDYIWGGTKLRSIFNKKCDLEKVAESWELSCHKDGNSVISNGEYAGKTLSEYIKIHGSSVLGKNCERFENFPVLIKLIDAKDNLSVQVHPDNEYALRVEGEYGYIGISDYAQHALGNVVYVDMPEVDDEVTAGEEFGAVESVKAASDLISPVSGTVVEINEALEDTPELLNEDAFANWIIKVQLSDPSELDKLMDAEAYKAICN